MTLALPNFLPALPEIVILVMACVALLVDLFIPKRARIVTFLLVQLTLIAAAVLTIYLYNMPDTVTFYGLFVHDKVASLLKLLIYICSFFAFIYARQYIRERHIPQGEYYVLGLFSVLGMLVLVSANDLLVLFLGLELLSLPLYAMIAMHRKSDEASEAAMKYYVMGAMASGILLYGLSMLYGVSGGIEFSEIANTIANLGASHQLIALFALVFVIVGLAFKLGIAPFHMWAPDVYQGAPTPVTLFIGSAPKIAAFGMVVRLLMDAMPSLSVDWQQMLILLAIVSMALGNIVAIRQSNLKRMLAYSSIAHMGYMSLGIIAVTDFGFASAMFYIIIYAIMSLAAFAVIAFMSRAGFESENITDFKGLNTRSPWLAFMMMMVMFSMAGIPPTVGFFAKLGVLEALVNVHLVWLAAIALVFAVIGAYYYLAVVKVMYFEDPAENAEPIPSGRWDMRVAITINCLAVVVLGLFPSAIINLCRAAFNV